MSASTRAPLTPEELPARVRLLGSSARVPTIIGVVGSPGAGKTTLVERLVRELNRGVAEPEHQRFAHVPMDGFHLSDRELTRLGLLGRKGAPETFDVHGYAALLHRLRSPRAAVVYAPGFDRALEQPVAGLIPVFPSATTVLTEGNYLLLDRPDWRQVREQCREIWFCAPDHEVRIRRLVRRHVRFGKTPLEARAWVQEVDEPNARLVEATRADADLIVTPEDH